MRVSYSCRKVVAVVGVMLLASACTWASVASADPIRRSTPDDLFYNYYVPPVGPGGVGAELYLCPRPAPPLVGHTYITYQPLMPHEFLYKHHRYYTTFHDDAPPTRTSVHWW